MFNNTKGFSLMETLIYVAILSLIIGGLFSFSLTIAANRNKAYAAQEVQANIRGLVITDGIFYRTLGVGDPVAISTTGVLIESVVFKNLATANDRDNIELTATINYAGSASQDFRYSQNLQTAFSLKK
ncbi:MAG: hypothetical protein UT42_C0007G0007 [Candidatus Falkowbacteria bacterium GW2011_GWA2_39_24]|uniref:Uncharacterized protein n=1 Tax=Candidatus Falkowbacteria bacterium GW2011_GWA2_39_24 TaxID=1618634 RepID=A0A0G0NR09_9BACT|nr:MAG: hypothetical protein UT42_C0007G0007 [Candidatus Falkowbacteria bacterium GW2011_GWA2_39_24]